jgi:hypothetical protein
MASPVRVLVSAANAAAAWDLRCEMREKLIELLRAEHPESLPRSRNETVELQVRNRDELDSEKPRSDASRRAASAH